MAVFRIAGFAVIAAIMALMLKAYKPDIAVIASIIAGIFLLVAALEYVTGIVSTVFEMADEFGFKSEYITTILKAIGIGYVVQFATSICKDAGESAIAEKVELAGRVLIVTLAIPLLVNILNIIRSIVSV